MASGNVHLRTGMVRWNPFHLIKQDFAQAPIAPSYSFCPKLRHVVLKRLSKKLKFLTPKTSVQREVETSKGRWQLSGGTFHDIGSQKIRNAMESKRPVKYGLSCRTCDVP
jgi:hypothetical protein